MRNLGSTRKGLWPSNLLLSKRPKKLILSSVRRESVSNMAWFLNYYECPRCGCKWTDDWSCMCDDDCRKCGNRHISPYDSDERTQIIEQCGANFIVLRSADSAEHSPEYGEIAIFGTMGEAEAFLENAGE
jgi:hypothetical protein